MPSALPRPASSCRPPEAGAADVIEIGGRRVPVRLRRHPRARRIILRIDAANDGVVLTLPPGASPAEAMNLAREKSAWIGQRLARLGGPRPFADGATVPVLGVDHIIRHASGARRGAWREAGFIHVGGGAEHLPRRLTDWFKAEARRQILPRVEDMAARIGKSPGRVTIRDTRSRWGSCAPSGNLSFCWRLVMAPEKVLDYVVAHEVAHLARLNHGTEFWDTVGGLGVDAKFSRAWLNRNGEDLHRYG